MSRYSLSKSFLVASAKAYPTVDPQIAKFVTTLGNVCSETERLPTSVILSEGLEKRGSGPVASGGLTDIWLGDFRGTQVAIKAFRINPTQSSILKGAKEVSIQPALEVYSLMNSAGFVEAGADVEESVT